MPVNPSLVTRVAVAKLVDFAIGLVGLLVMPWLWPDSSWMERIAFLLWYTTLGAFIGLAGVFTWHPVLRMPMPWWFSSTVLGAWMNLVLTLFMHERLAQMMIVLVGAQSPWRSPFWFVAEGAIVGLLIGYAATRCGGEGPATVRSLER